MSLQAATRHPLSNEDWVQSKVPAACQVTSHNTSSGPWRCSVLLWSTHLLLMQQQQTQGCPQHHLSHVSVVHTIGFCTSRNLYMCNAITLNSTMVNQGTQNPTSANPILLIKAEFNFSQLLTYVRIQHTRNQCTERLGHKGATNLWRL